MEDLVQYLSEWGRNFGVVIVDSITLLNPNKEFIENLLETCKLGFIFVLYFCCNNDEMSHQSLACYEKQGLIRNVPQRRGGTRQYGYVQQSRRQDLTIHLCRMLATKRRV